MNRTKLDELRDAIKLAREDVNRAQDRLLDAELVEERVIHAHGQEIDRLRRLASGEPKPVQTSGRIWPLQRGTRIVDSKSDGKAHEAENR